jgi:flavin reductase (DIM6/NTAB) family NADH-FMN oxidoreductase RutF
VVTCDAPGAPHGATVNSFTAVSLRPPLVLISLDRRSRLARHIEGKPFTVNVLHAGQGDLALHFAGRSSGEAVAWERPRADLAPQLAGSLATIACLPWRTYDGGDHLLHLGEVEQFGCRDGDPLVFFRGGFHPVGPASRSVPWAESGDGPELSWFSLSA